MTDFCLALAIQWGAIADVGMMVDNYGSNAITVSGTSLQQIASCLETLEYFLRQPMDCAVVSSHGLVEKVQKTSDIQSTPTVDLLKTISNILGTDTSNMSPDSTLADFGLDSLGSVEIKLLLEQKYSLSLATSKEVQQLTIQRLREIDALSSLKITQAHP